LHIRARRLPYALDRTRRHGIGLRRPLVMLLAGVSLMCVLIGASATAFAAGLCSGPPHRGSHRADRFEHRDVRDDCNRGDSQVAGAWWDREDAEPSRVCTSSGPRSDTTPPPSSPPAPSATLPPSRNVGTTGSVPPASAPPSVHPSRPSPAPTVRQPPVLAPPALTVPPSPAIAAPASVPVSIYVITIATLLAAAAIAVAALVLVRRAD
jgi:hypothetical protein